MCPSSLAARGFEAKLPPIPDIADLLPQAGNMILLDRMLAIDDNGACAELTVRADGLFAAPGAPVPGWVGVEYMAQTVAAFSGYHRGSQGRKIDLGFLLGTRYYRCSVAEFPCGTRLLIRAEKVFESSNGMSVFDCKLEGENILAAAQLNVLLPEDSQIFLAGKGL